MIQAVSARRLTPDVSHTQGDVIMKATKFCGRDINFNVPYTMTQEATFGGDQDVALEGFVWRMDKPFNVHRFIIQLTALDGDAVIDPQPTVLGHLINNVSIHNWGINENHGSGGVAFRVDGSTLVWEPMTELIVVRSGGFEVKFHARPFDINPALKLSKKLRLRAVVSIEGDAIVVAPLSA